MKRSFLSFSAICVLVFFIECPAIGQGQQANLKERFVHEAPLKWQEYDAWARRVQVRTKIWRRPMGASFDGQPDAQLRRMRNFAATLAMFSVESDDVRSECFCKNRRYAFELRKDKSSRPWYLKAIHPNLNSAEAKNFLSRNLGLTGDGDDPGVHEGPFRLYNRSVRSLCKERDFEILRSSYVVDGQKEFVRIEFTFRIHDVSAGLYRYENGWFVLNPAQCWSVVRFQGSCVFPGGAPKALVTGAHEYNANQNAFPVLKTSLIKVELTGNRQPITFNEKMEYIVEEREPTEEEFTLSAFGFNEPKSVSTRNSLTFLWFISAALAALGAGWYWRRRQLQRRMKTAMAVAAEQKAVNKA